MTHHGLPRLIHSNLSGKAIGSERGTAFGAVGGDRVGDNPGVDQFGKHYAVRQE